MTIDVLKQALKNRRRRKCVEDKLFVLERQKTSWTNYELHEKWRLENLQENLDREFEKL